MAFFEVMKIASGFNSKVSSGRSGLYNQSLLAQKQRQEIEQAVLDVKGGNMKRKPMKKWSPTKVKRWNYRDGKFWNKPKPRIHRIGQSDVVKSASVEMVSIRGRVPREFFEWFEEQAQVDWKNRGMLERCFWEKW